MSSFTPSRGYVEPYGEVFSRLASRTVVTDDGVTLAYEVLGEGPETIVLANGLGGRLYAWLPLVEAARGRYRIVTWDYRGLFASGSPESWRHMTVPQHARDLATVLDAEGVERAHLVGWSMGVQVCLELTCQQPERALSLTLINGTYGQVFSTALQPLFPLPFPSRAIHALLEALIEAPRLQALVAAGSRRPVEALFEVRKRLAGKRRSTVLLGLRQYVRDLSNTSFANYLHLFQALDAHSVYHLLPFVDAPTLVISGGLDYLTPARQSRALTRRIPGARHLSFPLATHFVLLERPGAVVPAILTHLAAAQKREGRRSTIAARDKAR